VTDEERAGQLQAFAARIRQIHTEAPMTVGRY